MKRRPYFSKEILYSHCSEDNVTCNFIKLSGEGLNTLYLVESTYALFDGGFDRLICYSFLKAARDFLKLADKRTVKYVFKHKESNI